MSEIKVTTSVQRRHRGKPEEKRAMIEEAESPYFDAGAIERYTHSRTLNIIEDVLSKGEAYISEDNWLQFIALAEKIQNLFEKFNSSASGILKLCEVNLEQD
jgi:hypothetical protein